jgi:hypothetical protein
VLTISSGHSATYLTDAVAVGRENYYTGAVAAGEPPGRWYGAGAERLGLVGLVETQDMTALFEHFVDPRDPGFRDPSAWGEAATLGHRGRAYIGEEELYKAACQAEPDASAERRAELRLEAGKRARRNVAFLDATFSVQKSVTVLHAAFEAQEVRARQAGDDTGADAWAAHKDAVEAAIWAGNNAALDYLARHAGTPGWGITGARRGGTSMRTSSRWRRSSSTTPVTTTRSCTSTTRSSTASRDRTRCGGRWTGAPCTPTAALRRRSGSGRWRSI